MSTNTLPTVVCGSLPQSEILEQNLHAVKRAFKAPAHSNRVQVEPYGANPNDGTFLMSFYDFVEFYTHIFAAIDFPASWHTTELTGEWTVRKGCLQLTGMCAAVCVWRGVGWVGGGRGGGGGGGQWFRPACCSHNPTQCLKPFCASLRSYEIPVAWHAFLRHTDAGNPPPARRTPLGATCPM